MNGTIHICQAYILFHHFLFLRTIKGEIFLSGEILDIITHPRFNKNIEQQFYVFI